MKTALCFLILGLFIFKTADLFRTIGEGYRDSVGYLNSQVKKGETVLCYPYYWTLDVNFYLDKMGSTLPNARPLDIASAPFLIGGGGVDPKPDFSRLEKQSKQSGKIYLVSEGSPGLGKGDSIQNRIWLSAIQQTLMKQHPRVKEMMFEGQTQTPIRLQVYE